MPGRFSCFHGLTPPGEEPDNAHEHAVVSRQASQRRELDGLDRLAERDLGRRDQDTR